MLTDLEFCLRLASLLLPTHPKIALTFVERALDESVDMRLKWQLRRVRRLLLKHDRVRAAWWMQRVRDYDEQRRLLVKYRPHAAFCA